MITEVVITQRVVQWTVDSDVNSYSYGACLWIINSELLPFIL